MRGRGNPAEPTYMTVRERIDFAIIILEFGALTGVVNSFSILTAQFFEPYGYSDTISGLMGATLLLVGIVAAGITAPLYDRVLTHHLGLSCKILCPILAVLKPHNTGALFALMAIMGATSLTMLPVALELAVELTRNADGSSAILWFACNLFGIIFVLVEGALRAPDTANPPENMRRALIFQGAFICGTTVFVAALQGKQRRREMDELRMKEVIQQDNSERSLT
ncbi:hypothetical protein NLI96_g3218 [Meripilus lineatus]|uniref:Uncharacterized protein n=1 Tax=Meripilus lineatus TaxID=2056292 RepID=A0AAD5VCM0_9APHY|nr:hypothetical protein NLI96_g3218 [Physisporinus lineatus]